MNFFKAIWNSSTSKFSFTMAMLFLTMFFISAAFGCFAKGNWLLGLADIVLVLIYIYYWVTKWHKQVQ